MRDGANRSGNGVLGCMLDCSQPADQHVPVVPGAACNAVAVIAPVVMVPVLSSSTVSTLREASSA